VRGQSQQEFSWLVFFDEGTPQRFVERIGSYESGGHLEARFVAEGGEPEWEAVREQLLPDCDWVLTTRLDNDDALHVDFVATLQAAFRPLPGLLNLPQGYVLDARRRRLYGSRQLANPFLSRCEPRGEVRTVLQAGAHDAIGAAVQQVAAGPLWLQVVHGRNAANRVTPHMQRLPLATLDSGFCLEGFSTEASESRLARGFENGLRRVSSVLRRGLRRTPQAPQRG
jgi:hypothetical protein